MKRWLRHPIRTLCNQRDDQHVALLVWAIAARGGQDVEHESLRERMGWSARRFDQISDMAINIGFIDYRFDFHAPPQPGGQAPVLYHLTEMGHTTITGR